MGVDLDVELRMVVSAGILARTDAEALCRQLDPAGPGLLARLEADGRITAATSASLRAGLLEPTIDQRPLAMRALSAPLASNPSLTSSSGSFPVPGWDRYEQIRVLGEGGMGRVFLARDLRLDRLVAMKFVRGDEPELAARVVSEARAQARVNDERVCKVFEVGEVNGRVYIAMQYVDGKPLSELVDELSYEQKALVMRGAALGVQAAHAAGLIHRDLKPTNIMVERDADGTLRPYVMDFGIAREWNGSATATGTVLGTPQFMAPEQARGEVKLLDRRADVYSLGATLYALLTGHAPIEGDNPLVVLNRLSIDEPARPRTHDRDLPADLEAIVMKCLEKDRGARYESARALADDLGRFLDGAPVAARASAGVGYRLRKAARRHWRALAVVTAMVAVGGVALGYGLHQRDLGERRAALARRFTERVERIEALARYAALAPAHDLAPDRAQIRAQMDELTDEVRAAGGLARGAGRYALGRGYLALGDRRRALEELEAAWAAGFREPRAAYALALTEGELYQDALRELELLPSAVREVRRAEIERTYRDPARAHLRASAGTEVPSQDYVQAMLAYYDGRLDDALAALAHADAAHGTPPWFYEVPLLRGRVLHSKALASRGRASTAELDQQFAAARRAFAAAAAVGESEPDVFLATAEFEFHVMSVDMYGRGQVDPPYQAARAAVDRALQLEPDRVEALLLRAHLARSLAEFRASRGEDAAGLVAAAIADGRRAVALAPTRLDAKVALASCLRQDGDLRYGVSQDPSGPLAEAIAILESIPAAERDDQALTQLGLAHETWANALDEAGRDASAHRQGAIVAYEAELARNPRYGEAWLNLGINFVERARHAPPVAAGVAEDVARAIDALEQGRALRPQSVVPDFYQGDALALRADHIAATGGDPDPDRMAAIERYQHGLTISPDLSLLHNGISIVEAQRAEAAIARGADATATIERAEASARRAIAAAPDQAHGYNNLAEAYRMRAVAQVASGADPHGAARDALAALREAMARQPDNPDFARNAARIELLLARYERDHGGTGALTRATAAVARAQSLAPDDPETAALVDELAALPRR